MTKIIIFDFDGTIADTLDSVVRIVNNNAEHFGYRQVTKHDIPYLQTKKPKEILSYLGISLFQLPIWIRKIHSDINKEIISLKPTVDVLSVLSELDQNDYLIGILTSNTKKNVKQFLEKNNLDFFDFINTGKSVFGKSHLINKILRQNQASKDDVFYVCDEVRDIEAAKKSGIQSIAVTWGYNSKNALLKEKPDFLIDTPEQIREILAKN